MGARNIQNGKTMTERVIAEKQETLSRKLNDPIITKSIEKITLNFGHPSEIHEILGTTDHHGMSILRQFAANGNQTAAMAIKHEMDYQKVRQNVDKCIKNINLERNKARKEGDKIGAINATKMGIEFRLAMESGDYSTAKRIMEKLKIY
jgi:hypothetical protein